MRFALLMHGIVGYCRPANSPVKPGAEGPSGRCNHGYRPTHAAQRQLRLRTVTDARWGTLH